MRTKALYLSRGFEQHIRRRFKAASCWVTSAIRTLPSYPGLSRQDLGVIHLWLSEVCSKMDCYNYMSVTAPSSSFLSLLPHSAILLLGSSPGRAWLYHTGWCIPLWAPVLFTDASLLFSSFLHQLHPSLLSPFGRALDHHSIYRVPQHYESGHPCLPQCSLTPARPPPIAMWTYLLLQAAVQTRLASSREITDLLRIWTVLFSLQPFPQQNVGCCVNIRCCKQCFKN